MAHLSTDRFGLADPGVVPAESANSFGVGMLRAATLTASTGTMAPPHWRAPSCSPRRTLPDAIPNIVSLVGIVRDISIGHVPGHAVSHLPQFGGETSGVMLCLASSLENRSAAAEGHPGERHYEQVGDHIPVAGHFGLQALHLRCLLGSGRTTSRGHGGAEFLDSLACWPLSYDADQ